MKSLKNSASFIYIGEPFQFRLSIELAAWWHACIWAKHIRQLIRNKTEMNSCGCVLMCMPGNPITKNAEELLEEREKYFFSVAHETGSRPQWAKRRYKSSDLPPPVPKTRNRKLVRHSCCPVTSQKWRKTGKNENRQLQSLITRWVLTWSGSNLEGSEGFFE